ncbi:TIM beta/alpha-barrel domain-containing protein [Dictyostelium discoideum AX4]|uniref:PI-PLC X-box domain-containing protein DDB_G0293730 n=1 Tax=Dictyostelium discoideum TaxID=44689 RepID=Y3730_DICDI|nr:TIM beta/alpha-barrel domain-containing protein [Dictyostelium discoideum AX4]Q54BH5.2 RecName: Full=PI-PLC X-box domain-containing protein DDB_G0293730 [Dictyostelium discoideum]EAL60677.2 TIM beta/alpha-barrel domain-containing protein [Dictyostelium discoideum AX4]|eukprot:XP_629054.2 TIM beta/alpha-barrel domain-containing protein [Dictyostelium discoideum AX4]
MEQKEFDIKNILLKIEKDKNETSKKIQEKYKDCTIEDLEKSLRIQNKKSEEITFISKKIEELNEKLIVEKYKPLLSSSNNSNEIENEISPKIKEILIKNSILKNENSAVSPSITTTDASASLSFGGKTIVLPSNQPTTLRKSDAPADTKHIKLEITNDNKINIIWQDAKNYQSKDWVALYNYKYAPPDGYVNNTWYWAGNKTSGKVETGVTYDANRTQQVRYYNYQNELISQYTVESQCWIDIHGDLGSGLQVNWPNYSTSGSNDIIAIHNSNFGEPKDLANSIEQCYANKNDGDWVSEIINCGLPYYAVYWSNIGGGNYIKQACSKPMTPVDRKLAIGEYYNGEDSYNTSVAAFYDSRANDDKDYIMVTLKEVDQPGTPGYNAKAANGIVLSSNHSSYNDTLYFWGTYCSFDNETGKFYIRQKSCALEYRKWITDNYSKLKDRKVRNLVLPGSHDSATYFINSLSPKSPDADHYKYPDYLLTPWSKTQTCSVYKQLCFGVRYFDLRVARLKDKLYIIHNFYSDSVKQVLKDILQYVSENVNEVIILHWSHLYLVDEDNKLLMKMIIEILGKFMSNSNKGPDVKVGDLAGTPIICIYDDLVNPLSNGGAGGNGKRPDIRDPRLWDPSCISSPYETSRYHSFESILKFLKSRINVPKRKVLHVCQAILTIEFSYEFFGHDLITWTVEHRNKFNEFFNDLETFASPTNIIMTDFVTFYPLSSYCIRRNTLEFNNSN